MTIDPGLLSVVILLIVHTGALFYWGGTTSKTLVTMEKLLEEHSKRLLELEKRHAGVARA